MIALFRLSLGDYRDFHKVSAVTTHHHHQRALWQAVDRKCMSNCWGTRRRAVVLQSLVWHYIIECCHRGADQIIWGYQGRKTGA